MYPVFLHIPLGWVTVALVALLFGAGGVIRARFRAADRDASYLASFLGLAVKWGEVQAPWGTALVKGATQAAITFAVAAAGLLFARQQWPGTDSIPLHTYGLMMASAFVVGIWLATRQAQQEGLPPVVLRDGKGRPLTDSKGKKITIPAAELVADLAFYLLIAGLVGSRILYILTRWEQEYARDPARVLRIWEGGLVWYGGLIGATLIAVWFVRKHKVAFLPYADVIVPSVAIGHALGRLGCFAAGCCFGNVAASWFPSSLAARFPQHGPGVEEFSAAWSEHRRMHLIGDDATHSLPVYPTQLMEAGGELLIFFALIFIRSRKRFHGQVLLSYLYLYPLLRVVMEMFRGDSIRGFFFRWPSQEAPMLLSTSQGVSILVALAAIALNVVLSRHKERAPESAVKPAV